MINPTSLRIGNWINPTGRSKYVVVTGLLLGMMEKNEDFCKEFEGIELTAELLEAAGFGKGGMNDYSRDIFTFDQSHKFFISGGNCLYIREFQNKPREMVVLWYKDVRGPMMLHTFQNLYHIIAGSELPLPESAKIIPEGVGK